MIRTTVAAVLLMGLIGSGSAWAQDPPAPRDVRPAITTFWGDTGLWFVPTGEVLKTRGWAFGAYRTELDFKQGASDVSFFPATFAIGTGSRTEIFGALRTVTAIDRDTRPLFTPTGAIDSGVLNEYPFVREEWTGSDFGDLYLGTKINLLSEHRLQPLAMALRGTVKLPTADKDGVGSGEWDYFADAIVSKEVGRAVELSGFGGFAFRGDPTGISLSDGVRWGLGAAFAARSSVRFTAELHGEVPSDGDVLTAPGVLTGTDGSSAPALTELDSRVNAAAGITWQHPNGMLLGVGLNYRFGVEDTDSAVGLQLRLGFHSGVRIFVPPPPPPRIVEAPPPPPVAPPPPPPAPAPAPNRQPTVKAECDPCKVEVGQSVTLRAISQDPDGDALSARWTVPAGTIADARAATTQWRAETAPGTLTFTVTAEDSRGGTASSNVTVEVIGASVQALGDIQFDLDQSVLRPDAMSILAIALKALNDAPARRLHIEGYASDDGDAEYNRQLGERRAGAVRDYLVSQGINAARITTFSFGEERPKYDTSQEATRRLNRRAALVLR